MNAIISIGLIIQLISRISTATPYRVYHVLGGSTDWYNANEMCLEQEYDIADFTLATISDDPMDYTNLRDAKDNVRPRRNRIADDTPFWVGLFRNALGEFAWADGTACETNDGLCVSDWATTPPLGTTGEYCVTLTVNSVTEEREYNAVSCNSDYPYVCSFMNNTTPSPIHDEDPAIGMCGDDTYSITGQACEISGDPHTWGWNGARHDFMGNPQVNYDDFYYVAPCFDATPDDLPFTILGHHNFIGWGDATTLDYLILELFMDSYGSSSKYDKYYLWFSSAINAYIKATDADHPDQRDNPDYDYHRIDTDIVTLAAGDFRAIGTDNKFQVKYTKSATGFVEVWLKINNVQQLHFTMRPQIYVVGERDRMHHVIIDPPTNYRCFICGLCGDFKRARIGGTEDPQQMITCNGGLVNYQWGWTTWHPNWEFAYDLFGNTWSYEYLIEQCPIYTREAGTRRLIGDAGEYMPQVDENFVYVDPCVDYSYVESIEASLAAARATLTAECDILGDRECDIQEAEGKFDVCAVCRLNMQQCSSRSVIDAYVAAVFTSVVRISAGTSSAHAFVPAQIEYNGYNDYNDYNEAPDDNWNNSGVVIEITSRWIVAGGLLLSLILIINCVYMCYVNTSKSRGRKRYSPVKFADSEYDSEAHIIQQEV